MKLPREGGWELQVLLRRVVEGAADPASQRNPAAHLLRLGIGFRRLKNRIAPTLWERWATVFIIGNDLAASLDEVEQRIAAVAEYRKAEASDEPAAVAQVRATWAADHAALAAPEEPATPEPRSTSIDDFSEGPVWDWPPLSYPDDVYYYEAGGIWAMRNMWAWRRSDARRP